jgi:hypothetical protein
MGNKLRLLLGHGLFDLYINRNPIPPSKTPSKSTNIAKEMGSTNGANIGCACT